MGLSAPDPLWLVVDRNFNVQGTEPNFTAVFGRLYLIASALDEYDATFSQRLAKTSSLEKLHPVQEKSFWTIWRWWTNHAIYFRTESTENDWPVDLVNGTQYVLKTTDIPSLDVIRLMAHELGTPAGPFAPGALANPRQMVVVDQALRKLAIPSYLETLSTGDFGDLRPLKLLQPVEPLQKVPYSGPRILGDAELAGSDPRSPLGIDANPCPWLPEDDGLPFFLWDRHTQRTVETSSLQSRPAYTAISHTWGRWRKVDQGRGKTTVVRGVDQWKVPENTIFDVKDLPELLAKVPTSTRFIWFDLICIPQDRSQRAQDEIARQAEIFRNASHAIIWLSKFESWRSLQSAITWMSLVFLEVHPDPFYKDRPYAHGPSMQKYCTGLFEPYTFEPSIRRQAMAVCGWFDSLWTLQEVCLRPDMWLCNQDWELLTVGIERVPVAINALVALTNACVQVHMDHMALLEDDHFLGHDVRPTLDPSITDTPADTMFGSLIKYGVFHPGFLELFELFDRSGLDQLLVMQPKNVLDLGSRRYCKSRRAEAIMSVLGVKSWYQNIDNAPPDTLVLGQYPLRFVQEAAKNIGASFYDMLNCTSTSLQSQPSTTSVGSLMPFTPLVSRQGVSSPSADTSSRQVFPGFLGEEQHESVAGWTIRHDGSVQMSTIGCIASSLDPSSGRQEEIECSLWLRNRIEPDADSRFPQRDFNARFRRAELRSWLTTYLTDDGPNYAIELFYHSDHRVKVKRGIILKEFKLFPGVLVKIGQWASVSNRAPPETVNKSVNWLVY
ncbi:hypothetical protein ACHAP7_007268 [Fusarium lateritium]